MSDEGEAPTGDMDAAFDKAFEEGPPSSGTADEATATPAPAEAPAPGPTRNEKGQFTTAEPTEAPPQTDTPAATDAPPAEVPPTDIPPAAEVAATYPEFVYKSAGREFNIPGSKVGADGAFIPTPALPAITRLLAEGQHAKDASRDFAQRLQSAKAEGQQELQRARGLLAALNNLRQQGPEAIAEWFEDLDRNWPLMEAKAENDILKQRQADFDARQKEVEQERQAEALVPQLKSVLTDTLAKYAERPEMAGVDVKRLHERLSGRLFDQVFEEATEQDVAEGIAQRVGQVIVNYGVIEDEMKYEADVLRRAREAGKQVQQVAQQNTARVAAPNAPPTVGAKKGAAPAGGATIPKFHSAREADDWAFGD